MSTATPTPKNRDGRTSAARRRTARIMLPVVAGTMLIGSTTPAHAAPSSFSAMNMQMLAEGGTITELASLSAQLISPENGSTITANESFQFKTDFSLGADKSVQDGDTIVFEVPNYINVTANQLEVADPDGVKLGEISGSTQAGLTLTFNAEAATRTNLSGSFTLVATPYVNSWQIGATSNPMPRDITVSVGDRTEIAGNLSLQYSTNSGYTESTTVGMDTTSPKHDFYHYYSSHWMAAEDAGKTRELVFTIDEEDREFVRYNADEIMSTVSGLRYGYGTSKSNYRSYLHSSPGNPLQMEVTSANDYEVRVSYVVPQDVIPGSGFTLSLMSTAHRNNLNAVGNSILLTDKAIDEKWIGPVNVSADSYQEGEPMRHSVSSAGYDWQGAGGDGDTPPPTITIGDQSVWTNQDLAPIQPTATGKELTFTATGLPEGMAIDASTGEITGTVATSGTYSIVVTATDSLGQTASATSTVTVKAPAIDPLPEQNLWKGQALPEGVQVTGDWKDQADGTVDGVADVEVLDLPDGVSFDPQTMTFSGTPEEVGEHEATVTIWDEFYNELSTTQKIAVKAPTLAPIEDQSVAEGTAIADVVPNWTGPDDAEVTIAPASGSSLPDGVTYDEASGTLSGTPAEGTGTSAGKGYDFVASYTDAYGNTLSETFTITVTADIALGVAEDDKGTTDYMTPVTVDVLDNDTEAPRAPFNVDTLQVTGLDAAKGSVEVTDGKVVFTPAEGVTGDVEFSYTISDELEREVGADVVVTVGEPAAPVAEDDSFTGEYGAAITGDVLGNDSAGDDRHPLDASTLKLTGADADGVVTTDDGTFAVTDGEVVFTPAKGFHGQASVDYQVADDRGVTASATATFEVTTGAPTATEDNASTPYMSEVTIDVLDNDSAFHADFPLDASTLKLAGLDEETEGSAQIVDGKVVFTPAKGVTGAVNFTYTVADTLGQQVEAKVRVEVGEPDAPVAANDSFTGEYGSPISGDVVSNDSPGDERHPLDVDTLKLVEANTDGEVVTDEGTFSVADGKVVFTPAKGFHGSASVDYQVADDRGQIASATAAFEVTTAAPAAMDDNASTSYLEPVTIDVLDNDEAFHADFPLDASTLKLVDADEDGKVVTDEGTYAVVDGKVVFTPVKGFAGTATAVTYEVADSTGATTQAQVGVEVATVAPNAADDAGEVTSGESVTIDVLGNDDAGHESLELDAGSLALVGANEDGVLVLDEGSVKIVDGKIVVTVNEDATQFPAFEYTVANELGTTATASVNVKVTAPVTPEPEPTDPEPTDPKDPTPVDPKPEPTDPKPVEPVEETATPVSVDTGLIEQDSNSKTGLFAGLGLLGAAGALMGALGLKRRRESQTD